MTHLATLSAAAATLRDALTAIQPLPSAPLLDAHHHLEEILLCVARHEEEAARERAAAAIRESQDRLQRLRKDVLRHEMTSPRLTTGAPVAPRGLPDVDKLARAANTRVDIERAFGIQPQAPATSVTAVVPLQTGGKHA